MFNIIICNNYDEVSLEAFKVIKEVVKENKQPVLGLATGSTPIGLYKNMKADYKTGFSYSKCITFNLDEYVGLSGDNEQSYRYFMNKHLFNEKPFKATYVPNGKAEDLAAECRHYEEILANHPIDIQILGIGENAHIGFNEPGTPFDAPTQVVELTESTINANKRNFEKIEDVPTTAISMGIGSIMKSKKVILIAYGEAKAEAIANTINGDMTTDVPASVLQNHPDVTVIVDEEASKRL